MTPHFAYALSAGPGTLLAYGIATADEIVAQLQRFRQLQRDISTPVVLTMAFEGDFPETGN